jgi:hypothetical protein
MPGGGHLEAAHTSGPGRHETRQGRWQGSSCSQLTLAVMDVCGAGPEVGGRAA